MRNICIVLGAIAAIIAVVLSALPLFNLAFIPAIIALVLGLVAFYLSKQQNQSKKIVQLIFLLILISLSLSTYKAIFNTTEVGDTKELEVREDKAKEDAIEELEELDFSE